MYFSNYYEILFNHVLKLIHDFLELFEVYYSFNLFLKDVYY